jgi:CTP synthase
MRLGAYPCVLKEDSLVHQIYQEGEVSERHRHRYEFNREYEEILTSYGLEISGNSPDNNFVEIVEIPEHLWFVAVQFHPEFKSKPTCSHPLFAGFMGAAVQRHVQRAERSPDQEVESTASDPEKTPRSEARLNDL